MGGRSPFLCDFDGERKAQLEESEKYTKKQRKIECSCIRNFFITIVLERKIGAYTNHNSLYL